MLNQFEASIKQHLLFDKQAKLLVAISGGVDSSVLASLLFEGNYNFALAHCNFQLRGKASDEDEQFILSLAKVYGVKCFTKKMNVYDHDGSVQMAARDLRYGWFYELMENHGFDYILTAHHLEDNFETALFNLVKGTGIAGLRGIQRQNGKLVRPLLDFTKEEIYRYAKSKQLKWREDVSNLSSKYGRNLIRNNVIPQLKKINPDFHQTYKQTAAKLSGVEKTVKHYIDALSKRIVGKREEGIYIDKKALLETADPVFVLHQLVDQYGFNYHQVTNLINANANVGKVIEVEGFELVNDREFLILTSKSNIEVKNIQINQTDKLISTNAGAFYISANRIEDYQLANNKMVAALDLDLLAFPLKIRNWEAGDKFVPLGMHHKKKLSDFMIDNKIPLNLKKRIVVVTSGDDIVWIAGHRIDDRFKLTEKSKAVFEIKMQKND